MSKFNPMEDEIVELYNKLEGKTKTISVLRAIIDSYRKSIEEISSCSADTEVRYAMKKLTVKPPVE